MKQYHITNPAFTGHASIVYRDGQLVKIDVSETNMTAAQVDHFKRSVHVDINQLTANFSSQTTIVEASIEITFSEFYKAYPYKRNRYKAEKEWNKLSKTDQLTAFYSLTDYAKYLKDEDWLTPQCCDTYLNQRNFETNWKTLKRKRQ